MLEKILSKYKVMQIIVLFVIFAVILSNVITIIVMSFVPDPAYFIAHSVATGVSFVASLSLALFSSKLYFKLVEAKLQAMENYKIDSLTGLYSRKPFIEDFNAMLDTCESCRDLSVMILDLDHFKSVNDTYGHQAGDAVMTKVGQLLRSIVREGDLVARFGGEEFVIVMCNIGKKDISSRAEAIRSLLDSSIDYDNKTIAFSTSIGCYHTESLQHELDEILRHADEQLYKAKNSGRNRFEVVYY